MLVQNIARAVLVAIICGDKAKGCWLLLISLLSWQMAYADADNEYMWTDFVGAQVYKKQTVPWARTLRGIGYRITGGKGGSDANLVDLTDVDQFAGLEKTVQDLTQSYDLIIPTGGLLAAKEQPEVNSFMTMMEKDNGKRWKEIVQTQAEKLASVTNPKHRIYWQIGNEINSVHYTEKLAAWTSAGKLPVRITPNDRKVIPVYVEYYLAPTVEALSAARTGMTAAHSGLSILLGSIANIANPDSQQWLSELLNYRIQGRFAPSLQGQQVHQLIDLISIHYLLSNSLETGQEKWDETLTQLYHTWVRSGHIKGIWLTEELGYRIPMRNQGGVIALGLIANYLSWVERQKITPEQGRISYWGWWLGNADNNAGRIMSLLYDFMGDVPVHVEQRVARQPNGDIKVYSLTNKTGDNKNITIFSSLRNQNRIDVVPLLGLQSWKAGSTPECYVVRTEDLKKLDCAIDGGDQQGIHVQIKNSIWLNSDQMGLIMIKEKK